MELGGKPPASQFGGTQTGVGSNKGALLDTGSTPLGRLAVAPWTASATQNSASGLADLVLLDLGTPGTQQSASLRVLQSKSDATYSPTASTGSSSSDGAILNLGGPSGLTVDLLHAESNSTGAGSSYLLSINGNQIGTSQQANGQCTITIPGLLTLNCLTSSGGPAGNIINSGANVGTLTLGPAGSGLTGGAFEAKSTSSAAPTGPVSLPTTSPASSAGNPPASAPASSPAASPAASASASHSASALPFTGANIGILLGAALGLGAAGFGLVAAARRRRPALAVQA